MHQFRCITDQPYKPLTRLLLQCWQRQHDRRPYNTMLLNRRLFAEAFNRQPDEHDWSVIVAFLTDPLELRIDHFDLNYVPLPPLEHSHPLLCSLAGMTSVSLCHVELSAEHLRTLLTAPDGRLQSLRISGNALTVQHVRVLHETLPNHQRLAYLDLGYCSIDTQMLALTADAIRNCVALRAIDLSRLVPMNRAHCADIAKIAIILAQLLWPGSQLFEVHFRHNGLDGHDIVPMVESMRHCANLVYLDLGANRLGATGAQVLFDAIREAPHLIGLDVSGNRLGELGALAIVHALSETRIRYLDIGRNEIPASAMRMLLSTLKKQSPLRICNIIGNGFDATVGQTLRRLLDARVLLLNGVDVVAKWDANAMGLRIVPQSGPGCWSGYNERYHRVQPLRRANDAAPNLMWHTVERQQLVVNGLFVDAIFLEVPSGDVYTVDERGRRLVVSSMVHNF